MLRHWNAIVLTGLISLAAVVPAAARAQAAGQPCEAPGVAIDKKLLGGKPAQEVRRKYQRWLTADTTAFATETNIRMSNVDAVARIMQSGYPPELRDRGLGGVTSFVVLLDTKGTLQKWELDSGSRYVSLDDVARNALRTARFQPMLDDNGCAVQFLGRLEFTFRSS